MSKVYAGPYINFQGRAREAMEFYHRVLGGKLDAQAANDRGEAKASGPGDHVIYARLEAEGAVIIGTDGHPKFPAKVGENWAIAVGGTDKDRITRIFNDLADGGKIKGPLAPQPWGAVVGWVTDRFGFDWTVSIDKA